MNHPIMFLDRENKEKLVPVSFFYELSWEKKKKLAKKCVIFQPLQSLCFTKKLIKIFYLFWSCKKKSKLGELKSNRKYFANKSGNQESLKK